MTRTRRIIDHRAWTTLAWSIAGAFAGLLFSLIPLGEWQELRIAACFFLPLLVILLVRHGLPPLLVALIAACFLLSGAGWAFDWYSDFWWFDVLLHGLNPVPMVAGTMFMLWKADLVSALPQKGRFVLIATGLGFLLGIVWELIEYTYLVLTWPDTILDIVMDTAGAAIGGHLAVWLIEKRGVAPVGRRPLMPQPAPAPVPVPVRR